jgi:hypothetical protein
MPCCCQRAANVDTFNVTSIKQAMYGTRNDWTSHAIAMLTTALLPASSSQYPNNPMTDRWGKERVINPMQPGPSQSDVASNVFELHACQSLS